MAIKNLNSHSFFFFFFFFFKIKLCYYNSLLSHDAVPASIMQHFLMPSEFEISIVSNLNLGGGSRNLPVYRYNVILSISGPVGTQGSTFF